MNKQIDLRNYRLVVNENNFIVLEGDSVLLENCITGEIDKALYSDVSKYFNLGELDVDTHIEAANGNTVDAFYSTATEVEAEDDGGDPEPGTSNAGSLSFKWEAGETKFMLDRYCSYMDCVGPLKQFRTKKQMWAALAEDINKEFRLRLNPTQVESRYKCLMKRRKRIIDNNNTSGCVRVDAEYEGELDAIISIDDSICPEFVISTQGSISKVSSQPVSPSDNLPSTSEVFTEQATPTDPPRGTRRRKTVQEIVFGKYLENRALRDAKKKAEKEKRQAEKDLKKMKREEERENKRQQRHNEKIKMLKEFLQNKKK